jgi:hypothetical protein
MSEIDQLKFKNAVREALTECFNNMTQEQIFNVIYSFEHLQEELLVA